MRVKLRKGFFAAYSAGDIFWSRSLDQKEYVYSARFGMGLAGQMQGAFLEKSLGTLQTTLISPFSGPRSVRVQIDPKIWAKNWKNLSIWHFLDAHCKAHCKKKFQMAQNMWPNLAKTVWVNLDRHTARPRKGTYKGALQGAYKILPFRHTARYTARRSAKKASINWTFQCAFLVDSVLAEYCFETPCIQDPEVAKKCRQNEKLGDILRLAVTDPVC